MSDLLTRITAALPAGTVTADPAVLAARASDLSGEPGAPDALAVVRPASTAEVSAVLALASEERVPVVPQGALSGLAGAANAVPGALLLDLSAMNAIVSIDETERIAVAQPGVIVADLQAAVAARGLFYPPDPASADRATLGGTVATNAGGMRAIKYGVTRDSVRSLEIVLADGTVTRTRRDTIKSVSGLDLTGLIVGSEGTLAVVTEITVALRPAPAAPRGVVGTFGSIADGLAAADAVASSGRLPATMELLDAVALDAIRRHLPNLTLPAEANAWLLAVTDEDADGEEDAAGFERAFLAHRALSVDQASTAAELDELFTARRALNPALRALRGASLNGDIVVPRGLLGEFAERLAPLAESRGVVVSVAGHVGDGNLHPIIAYDGTDPEQVHAAHAVNSAIIALAQELGGSMTGEHGVGTEKLPALAGELPERNRELQRAIKAAFDPLGILNPGKKY